MRKYTFLVVFEPNSSGGYGVYFPDVPGCISGGDNLEEAKEMAREALSLHICGMLEDGEEIPQPSENPEIFEETTPGYITDYVSTYADFKKRYVSTTE